MNPMLRYSAAACSCWTGDHSEVNVPFSCTLHALYFFRSSIFFYPSFRGRTVDLGDKA